MRPQHWSNNGLPDFVLEASDLLGVREPSSLSKLSPMGADVAVGILADPLESPSMLVA